LFLDEIGEIDGALQVKLLRALSEKSIQRVGSNKTISVDTRVVAATNQSLSNLVEDGEFREDLYFRLNVVKISPPALRDRTGDLPILMKFLIEKITKENELDEKTLSAEAITTLESQEWPGNVRQLSAVLENAAIMSTSSEIQIDDLPVELISRKKKNVFGREEVDPSIRFLLSEIEKETILDALDYTEQNKSEAANLLGISRRTLQRKLTDYNL